MSLLRERELLCRCDLDRLRIENETAIDVTDGDGHGHKHHGRGHAAEDEAEKPKTCAVGHHSTPLDVSSCIDKTREPGKRFSPPGKFMQALKNRAAKASRRGRCPAACFCVPPPWPKPWGYSDTMTALPRYSMA